MPFEGQEYGRPEITAAQMQDFVNSLEGNIKYPKKWGRGWKPTEFHGVNGQEPTIVFSRPSKIDLHTGLESRNLTWGEFLALQKKSKTFAATA